MQLSRNLSIANMSFNAIRENKILAKISGYTVVTSVSLNTLASRPEIPAVKYILAFLTGLDKPFFQLKL